MIGYHCGWQCQRCGAFTGPDTGPWTDETALDALNAHLVNHTFVDKLHAFANFLTFVAMEAEATCWIERYFVLKRAICDGKFKVTFP